MFDSTQPRNRAFERVPKSQVKIGQKLKVKVKIGTLKNLRSNFFYKLTFTKDLGVLIEKHILRFSLDELKIWK